MNGGNMTMTKAPPATVLLNDDYWELLDSGRWIETPVPTGRDGKVIYFANLWGVSGSRSHSLELRQTERLLQLAAARAASFGPVPYFLMGDFNVTPDDSETLQTLVSSGKWVNVIQMAAGDGTPPPTFRRNSSEPVVVGEGISWIDHCYTNSTGAALVRGVRYLYHIASILELQHIPIAIDLDLERLNAVQLRWVKPTPLPMHLFPKLEPQVAQNFLVARFGDKLALFQEAIQSKELDVAL